MRADPSGAIDTKAFDDLEVVELVLESEVDGVLNSIPLDNIEVPPRHRFCI